jgi:hypothetical protein
MAVRGSHGCVTEPPVDDPSILDDDELLRRLAADDQAFVVRDLVSGTRRPTSGAFKPDADGVSVYQSTLLADAGLSARDVMVHESNLVVGFLTADVRAIGLGIVPDRWPPDDQGHARGVAHALLIGLETLSKNERHRRQKQLATVASMRFVSIG